MQLTPNNVKRIQIFLMSKGFISEAPSEVWTPHKSSGYATYLESLGIPYPLNTEVPYKLDMLTKELRDFITIPDRVSVASEDESEPEGEIEPPLEEAGNENSEVDESTESEEEFEIDYDSFVVDFDSEEETKE
jgi:hypothetical protein